MRESIASLDVLVRFLRAMGIGKHTLKMALEAVREKVIGFEEDEASERKRML